MGTHRDEGQVQVQVLGTKLAVELYLVQGRLEVQIVPKHPTVGLGIHKDPCLQWPNQVSLEAGELEPFLMLNMSRGETKEGVIIVEMLLD